MEYLKIRFDNRTAERMFDSVDNDYLWDTWAKNGQIFKLLNLNQLCHIVVNSFGGIIETFRDEKPWTSE